MLVRTWEQVEMSKTDVELESNKSEKQK